jgi:hypothetical protein
MKNESLGEVTGLPTREHWKVSISFPSVLFIDRKSMARKRSHMSCELVIRWRASVSPHEQGTWKGTC